MISPLALEAVRRIDALFEIERTINAQSAERRKEVRQELSGTGGRGSGGLDARQRARLSRGNDVAKAMDYMLKRWGAFTRFLDDGRNCLSNNAAERAVRGIQGRQRPRATMPYNYYPFAVFIEAPRNRLLAPQVSRFDSCRTSVVDFWRGNKDRTCSAYLLSLI